MLIYNYKKEFVGIDESDLKALGFSDLSQLRSESADFADLFVKTPGFVHNFKHVHWIDFVACAEGSEDSKVIIRANGKNFRGTLDIKTAYLVDDPTQKAYIINLVNLRALTHHENEQVAGDVLEKPLPRASTQNTPIFNTPSNSYSKDVKQTKIITPQTIEEMEVTHDPYEVSETDTLDQLEHNTKVVEDIYEDAPINIDDELIEIDDIQESLEEVDVTQEDEKIEAPTQETPSHIYKQALNVGDDYVYDPHFASDELGLPIDLIEEFIQDFISQAHDFKDGLYNSLHDGNKDNVKILSHKLKGVAANLRIEDAFEVLSIINTSSDTDEIKTNLDSFYVIIQKLSEKSTLATPPKNIIQSVEEEEVTDEGDDLIISFKDDIEEAVIYDSQVPQKIEMPELADDDFTTIDDSHEEEIQEITLDENFDEIDNLDEIQNIDLEPELKEISSIKYNKAQAASDIGIDEESFETLLDDFIIEGRSACSEIKSAIEEDKASLWREVAIRLKRMSDNMRIYDFTAELESIINTQDSKEAKEAIDAISNKLEQISSEKV